MSMAEVEADLLAWVLERMPDKLALLAGSSVHVDKTFLVSSRCRQVALTSLIA